MGFSIKRIDKIGNDSTIGNIHEDYHNGECAILFPAAELEELESGLKYLVIDFRDYLVLIYPGKR